MSMHAMANIVGLGMIVCGCIAVAVPFVAPMIPKLPQPKDGLLWQLGGLVAVLVGILVLAVS